MFMKIWKDPVWSKVISAIIIGSAAILWSKFGSASFGATENFLNRSTPITNWIIALSFAINVYALSYYLISAIKKLFKKEKISNAIDAEAKIESWWPRAEGMFPNDVNVDYNKLSSELNISRFIIIQSTKNVAYRNCYKPKVSGENFATFEYDLERAMKQQ